LIYRLGLPLLVTVAQACAAALALGRPDPGRAVSFVAGGWPTVAETLAALELFVWAIVVAGAGWNLATLIRELLQRAVINWRVWERSALVSGVLILAAGTIHHFTYQVGMSGGSVQEAQSILGG
jgi:hypothetical protein